MGSGEVMSELSERKRSNLLDLLEKGKVQIRLNSNIEGVSLPDYLMNRIQVTLNLSYAFQPDIFDIDEDGIRVILSFSGQKTLCILPWDSVFFMQALDSTGNTNGVPEIFIESIPEEILEHYGLTIRVMEEDEGDEVPITRPLFTNLSNVHQEEDIEDLLNFNNWVSSLEKIDAKHMSDHQWPHPLEVIREVVEELDSRGLLDEVSSLESKLGQQKLSQKSREMSQEEEGEHTPEKGIISLNRFKRNQNKN